MPIQLHTTNLEAHFRALRNRDPANLSRTEVPQHESYRPIPRQNYPNISTAHGFQGNGMARFASAASAGTIYGQPQFFSPVHTPINWQIPSKRLEQYQWQVVAGEVLTEDFTYIDVNSVQIDGDSIDDPLTGGTLWENPNCPVVVSGDGKLELPSKWGERFCENKKSYEFSVVGGYKTFSVTEEHGVYVMDGKSWKEQRKLDAGDKYRLKKGTIPNNVQKNKRIDKFIVKKEAQYVSKEDYLITPIHKFKSEDSKELDFDPYYLGLCAADGCIKGSGLVQFSINENEMGLHTFENDFKNYKYNAIPYEQTDSALRVLISTNKIGTSFSLYVVGKFTKKKFTKKIFSDFSENQILRVLGGYFDGDGSYSPTHKTLVANNYSEDMANQLWWMLAKVGIKASIAKLKLGENTYPTNSEYYYRLVIPSSDVNILSPYMKSDKVPKDFTPKKKRNLKFFHEEDGVNYLCQPIDKISPFQYTGTGVDFQIDSNHSYVLSGVKVSNCRFFYENEPKVAASIDFYSYFPMSDWEHECKDRKVKIYFDQFKKRIELPKWCRLISHETHLLGDCFPFAEISCPICNGSGMIGDEICDHEGGTVKRMVILNPDFIDVHTPPLNPDPIIALRPDEELINMVQRKTPGHERLSPEVIALVSSGQPIRLDNRNVSHLKYGESGYSRYGIGMVRRLFPILSYKTKLMVAQWIVAERLIVPIKIVKVGSDERPAGPADIAAVQAQLAETANDPNLTIVTHHAFDFDFIGACHDQETEVLTENGWKKYSEVSKDYDEKIATYNLDNDCLEYEVPTEYHEYDFNGELCLFEGQNVNACVTPNHKMLTEKAIWNAKENKYISQNWDKCRADNVRRNDRFKTSLDWFGEIPDEAPYKKEHRLCDLSLDDYLEFLGYYLSEGSIKVDRGYSTAVQICQCNNSPCFQDMRDNIFKLGKVQETFCDRSSNEHSDCTYWLINDSKMAQEMQKSYGHKAPNKFIPNWILNLPQRELRIILNSLMDGDGNVRFSDKGDARFKYTTTSKKLADNVQEIVFKLGYSPMISIQEKVNDHYHDTYIVYWSDLRSSKGYATIKDRHIKREAYDGKVWCFTVPNGFFITRRNGKIGIHGNSGKVLTLSNEFEFINQEVLDGMMINNALLNGEGPTFCLSEDSKILTNNGLKTKDSLDIENDLVASLNQKTGALEYQKAIRKYEYDWDSVDGNSPKMKHFKTGKIDMLVTPNHKMLWAPRTCSNGKEGFGEWQLTDASEVKERAMFRASIDKWEAIEEDQEEYFGIPTDDFLRIVGWYVSEGWRNIDKSRNNAIYRVGISQCPKANPETHDKIKRVLAKNNLLRIEPSKPDTFVISTKMNRDLVNYLSQNMGEGSDTKKIPNHFKNLSTEKLNILLEALVEGDGSQRMATNKKPTKKKYITYTTTSTQLRDDVLEIVLKLGYAPTVKHEKRFGTLKDIYRVYWSDSDIGKFPKLASRDMTVKPQKTKVVIKDVDYVGKVWCVEVPNHIIISERNGKIGIHGNSSASVGIEAMIQRLTTFRNMISEWITDFLYLPEAKRQGFIDENPETGEQEWIVPKIKWNSMHLRDQQQYRTFIIQLYEKGLVSAQTVLESFDIDPDQEIERKRYDAVQMMALGQGLGQPQQGDEMGGGFGGGGGMDLGGGGMDLGGAPPIGAGGDMGGAPPAPTGGEAALAKTGPLTAEIADPSQFGGKVLKKKSREKLVSEQKKMEAKQMKPSSFSEGADGQIRDEKGRIAFTKIERTLMDHMIQNQKNGIIRYPIIPQYKLMVGNVEHPVDFALPHVKLIIEADGEIYHSAPKQVQKDNERDRQLNQMGWTVLRFKDSEIEKQPQQAISKIVQTIMKIENAHKNNAQK